MKPLISIVIRTKNESRWVKGCLSQVFSQSIKDIEVILVDNNSTDATVRLTKEFPVKKILNIDNFLPGKAINMGVDAAEGEFIVFLSAHCIPTDENWLKNLLIPFQEDTRGEVAGVYGRQEPMSFTDDLDKRDLFIVFGLDRKVQVRDCFFHNANSMVRRSVLEKIPFDATVTNIEDRVWAKEILQAGYKIVYEPSASVYHHHGIHQGANRNRAKNVVRIIESLDGIGASFEKNLDLLKYKISAVITSRGEPTPFAGKTLVEWAIESAKASPLVQDVLVATDNEGTRKLALGLGAKVPFLRPSELSAPDISIEKVLQQFVKRLDEEGNSPDLLLYLSTTHPFRQPKLIDWLIELQITRGFDSVMAGLPTFKSVWADDGDQMKRIDEGFVARQKKHPIHIAAAGLGCITFTEYVRQGKLLGDRVGILEVLDSFAMLEVGNPAEKALAEKIFVDWRNQFQE